MNIIKSTTTVYVGFACGVVAMVLTVVLPEYANFLWTVAALFGFGTAEALRLQIDSKGWKTATIFIVVAAISILQWLNVITPELGQALYVGLSPITGITITQALVKSPTASIQPASK